jgi:ABC-2 type transport system ATP-binding protein
LDSKVDEVISLQNVHKALGGRKILQDVTLEVGRGDIFGFLGPNGAGKTTSIRIMLGLFKADSGRALILGRESEEDSVREKVGFVLETDGLYDNLSAYDNLRYFGRIYASNQLQERLEKSIQLVGLADRLLDKVGTYSKGMRQRLALARATLHNPEVLILDEPTAGVDPSGQIEIRQIMLDMVHKENKTILLSSHNLDEVQRICNRIALIDRGVIRLYGQLDKLQHEMSHGDLQVETSQAIPDDILQAITNIPGVTLQDRADKRLTLSLGKDGSVPDLVAFLVARGVRLEQVKKQEASLEEIYTRILKDAEGK